MKWADFLFPPINLYTMPRILDSIDHVIESKTHTDTLFISFKSNKEKKNFLELYNKRKEN